MLGVDTQAPMRDVSMRNVAVTRPIHAEIFGDLACLSALEQRGVAHLKIAEDTRAMKLGSDPRPWKPWDIDSVSADFSHPVPGRERLQQAAASLINASRKVAMLVGQGALGARQEVTDLAAREGAL